MSFSAPTAESFITVALLGNPNTGKSTLFSALAGIHQHVGNYPGVTVEKKTGRMDFAGRRFELIDLPGLYSLTPRSRDEMVAVDLLLGRRSDVAPIDAVICILDASNLQRNLYLLSQVLEVGLPTVVAVNMLDVAKSLGVSLDLRELQDRLGVPVVGLQAHKGQGIADLKAALTKAISRAEQAPRKGVAFPPTFVEEAVRLARETEDRGDALPEFLAKRLLLDVGGYLEGLIGPNFSADFSEKLQVARERLRKAGCPVPEVETDSRYAWAHEIMEGAVSIPSHFKPTATDRIDRYLTHRVGGLIIFAAIMTIVFQAVFVGAGPAMDFIESIVGSFGNFVENHMADGALRSLIVKGAIGGVGGVLVFLPQILILFFFIGVLEDCGYMARAAFLMDRMMSRVGLSGKSFIPMLSSFACAVPGVMATRVIENERDRFTTILVTPLLTCSARLPVYALLIAAFIPPRSYLGGFVQLQGLTLVGLYALGIIAAICAAMIFKRTLFRGRSTPFVLELPSYKWPSFRVVFHRVAQRGTVFLKTAGTLILAVSIVVWAGLYYPRRSAQAAELIAQKNAAELKLSNLAPDASQRAGFEKEVKRLDRDIESAFQRDSYLGRLGRMAEPIFTPLGWDWRIGCAAIASFPAREVVVATLSVMFNAEEEGDDGATEALQRRLREATHEGTNRPLFSVPVALSIMVFFALCAQCAATLAVIRRETNSWRWPLFTFGYMTVLAYGCAFITYQFGAWVSS